MIKALPVILLFSSAPAFALQNAESDGNLGKARTIVTQPARDVGISKKEIPMVLQRAVEAPYGPPKSRTCKGLAIAIDELNDALGADFGQGKESNESKTGKLVEAGGQAVVNSLIPFRGLVREVSGAAPAQRRLEAAIATGLARRGYLRGIATAKRCKG